MASSNAVDNMQQPNQRQCPSGTNDHSDSNDEVPIRTVYVGRIVPNMNDRIHHHFGQFGEIESVAMRFEDKRTRWCLVQFKRAKDAGETLLRTGNKWACCDVRAADPWHQPDHPLQVAPEQDSDSNISVALNDDCLQDIFKRLKLSSLTNVAGVCKRFNQQAKRTFALKHKHLDHFEQFHTHRDLLESAMKHFGKDIQSLNVDADLFAKEADAIGIIGQYCGPKLKQLQFSNFKFQTDLNILRPIFAGIEQLKLYRGTSGIGLGKLMTGCGELRSLSLSSGTCLFPDNGHYILSRTFPKLQELLFCVARVKDEDFKNFVIRHPTLIKLSIENVQLSPHVLRTIGQHAKNLEELKIIRVYDLNSQFRNDVANIGQLSSLRKLQLDIGYSIVPVLNALIAGEVPIEHMEIQFDRQPDIDQAINRISQLKRIKILQLTTNLWTRRVTDEHVVELAEGLPELEALHLTEIHWRSDPTDFRFKSELSTIGLRKMLMRANRLKLLKLLWIESIKIDVDDYKTMLSTAQKRKDKVPLQIEIYGEADQIDIPAAVLEENRSTLNIKQNS